MTAPFRIIGSTVPDSPVVLSVPHAGRDYPAALYAALHASRDSLRALEDRYIDAVVLPARGDETLLVQDAPRAWIDLNRAEHERDPLLDDGAKRSHLSAKVRAGLGIVPRRTGATGEIWRRRLRADEVEARIAADHRPYHAALAQILERARDRFGVAVLLDLHSMPPLPGGRTSVVVGDRFGRSAAGRFVQRVETEIAAAGLIHALNTPYAGGHILERHAEPAAHIHAVQLEIDRALYLDARLDLPGAGLDRTVALVRAIIDALRDEALSAVAPNDLAQAAE
ncbi:N-formylglutamate amidohydrolase [Sphingomonas palmae]|uniref:N-formylglutamate amidohydrolase n=1 Tax=Sphingomonas palmae TaxID=1855283 RepID=A0A1H7LYD3_9SPHN|nr:N-formylglutamate amidohydrolase [Sphingomonas palmae]SEL03495.1 N-formylglutamate amidohydrolase [Sphingomonas palmae]